MRKVDQHQQPSGVRVLARIPVAADTLTPAEAALLAAFRAAADDAQPIMVSMMQSIAAGSPRQRPALTLVRADDVLGRKGGCNAQS
jgi:hypothetical protein